MAPLPQPFSIPVNLNERGYSVLVGPGLLDRAGELVRAELGSGQAAAQAAFPLGQKCAVISDSNVAGLYRGPVEASLRQAGFTPVSITVPAGEASKSLAMAGRVCDEMIAAGLDRRAWVVALGGGVVGDLAGFVAAIYYRGIPFVQLPTTVMAQVDSAVGGKTGVNAPHGKNLIGAFHQPRLVLADTLALQTLPPREFNEGVAEIIKHAAIRDRSLLSAITAELPPLPEAVAVPALFDRQAHATRLQFNTERLAGVIRRNVEIKADIVSRDEYETLGLRALLNFGHTIGHGIENAAGYGRYLHGEAISLGLVAAARLSVKKAGLPEADYRSLMDALARFGLPQTLPADVAPGAIMDALKTDKKFAQGAVRFILCPGLGEAVVSSDVTMGEIEEAVGQLGEK